MNVTVDNRGVQLWTQGQGVATLVNTDPANPVYIAYGTGVPTAQSDQIPPRGSITVDGNDSIQGSTLNPNVTVIVEAMPGVTRWTDTYTPDSLLIGAPPLASPSIAPFGGALTQIENNFPVITRSYKINLRATYPPASAPTIPFWGLNLVWFDTSQINSSALWNEQIVGSAGGGGSLQSFYIRGPAGAQLLNAFIANADPAVNLEYFLALTGTDQEFEETQVTQNGYVTPVAHYSNPAGDILSGVIGYAAPLVHPGTPMQRLLGTAPGRWSFSIDNQANANGVQVALTEPSGLFGLNVGAELYPPITVAAGSRLTEDNWAAPARPVLVTFTNQGGAGDITPVFMATRAR